MRMKTQLGPMKSLLALLYLVLGMTAAFGELKVVETQQDGGNLTTFKMTVTPAPEPVPALKHRLMLREIDLKQGNAAPYYYRALLQAHTAEKDVEDKFGDDLYKWYGGEVPLGELPLERVREAVRIWSDPMMTDLRTAAGRRQCDWQWNLEEIRGPELISFLLHEMQQSRSLARALTLRTRLALAEGHQEKALDCLRLNYRLARDVAEEPLLICDLVGLAITGIGNAQVIELIAQPDSPNLYWALSELPRPLISIRESVRAEMSLGLRTFPFVLDAETVEHSPDEWSRLLAGAVLDWQMIDHGGTADVSEDRLTLARAGVTGLSLLTYPGAKKRLIDAGMDPGRVERMPVGQVVAVDALREYRRIADELEKWYYVPYREARERKEDHLFRDRGQGPKALLNGGYGYVLAATLLPAIQAARTAEQRLLWQMDGIRTVEAIRMHAAQTGRLPKSLDEIKVVPVPENPATGKPFEYRLEGDTAILDLPFSDGFPGSAWRFEITLAE